MEHAETKIAVRIIMIFKKLFIFIPFLFIEHVKLLHFCAVPFKALNLISPTRRASEFREG